VVSDIVYGDSLADNEFILRDFATWGDAVRIKLPHIAQGVKNQYLWIYIVLPSVFAGYSRLWL